jgi:hypothetical protein
MKRRRWAVIGPVVLVMAAILGTAGVSCVRSKGPTPRQVEQQIRADVPLGTPLPAIHDYLRGRGIEFAATDVGDVDRHISDLAGVRDREDREIGVTALRAIVEPAFVDPLWPGHVTMYFFFDPKGRLIGYAFLPGTDAL